MNWRRYGSNVEYVEFAKHGDMGHKAVNTTSYVDVSLRFVRENPPRYK
jgi:hypothetical protein